MLGVRRSHDDLTPLAKISNAGLIFPLFVLATVKISRLRIIVPFLPHSIGMTILIT